MENMKIANDMLENRIIVLKDEINSTNASDLIFKLLYLDSINTNDIYLYINSPGGEVLQGLAIIDTMNYIKSKVITIVVGIAYSMAAIILSEGNKRYALPHSEIMIHEPMTTTEGKASIILNSSNRITKTKELLAHIIKKKSAKPLKKILEDMQKDYFLTPEEAKDYGLIDKIINK